jgi:hypothetical protein
MFRIVCVNLFLVEDGNVKEGRVVFKYPWH